MNLGTTFTHLNAGCRSTAGGAGSTPYVYCWKRTCVRVMTAVRVCRSPVAGAVKDPSLIDFSTSTAYM